jgi:hypothetical protein
MYEQSDAEPVLEEEVLELTDKLSPRWAAPLFAILAVALIPWIAYLAYSLPQHALAKHYNISWVGFDIVLLLALARTAWLAFREKRQVELPAVATATLLVVDAWFDVTTARRGWPFIEALALAVLVELPLAALCLYIAHRVERLAGAREGREANGPSPTA